MAAASATGFEDLRQAAGQIDTLIYPFLVRQGPGGTRVQGPTEEAARTNMEALAAASGGRVFYAAAGGATDPFRQVTEELRSVYTLAYYPKNQTFEGQWRKIEVRVKRPGVVVRTRDGYLAR
jgi:VWFA-related protein